MQIHKVAVIGSGVMGSTIAAHLANAGIPIKKHEQPRVADVLMTKLFRYLYLRGENQGKNGSIRMRGFVRKLRWNPWQNFDPPS